MTIATSARSAGLDRPGLIAAFGCYLLWGAFPLLFHEIGVEGAGPWEIVGWRTLFSVPVALVFVLVTGRLSAVREIARQPRQLLLLTLSAFLVASNWSVYVWAVSSGQTLSASLGYYINPLVNAAVGALFFRERISRFGKIALGLATTGVAVQALALGAPPWVALVLAFSFASYGIVRKQVAADAQTGILIECIVLSPVAIAILAGIAAHGGLHFGRSLSLNLLLLACGPATVIPLTMFAFAARRLPLNVIGFIQFLTPTILFGFGLVQGEKLPPLSLVAFGFIWTGVIVFATDMLIRLRRESADRTAAAAS
jgi:chloramphenicol-sensitive protein RarD